MVTKTMVKMSMKDINEQPRDRFAFWRPRGGQDIHLEVRPLPDGDGGAQENDPDETKAGDLFGPDVSRDKAGIAREDLEAHGDDHQPHEDGNEHLKDFEIPVQDMPDCVKETHHTSSPETKRPPAALNRRPAKDFSLRPKSYFTALIAANTFSAPISLAKSAFTGAASSRSFARSVKG